MDSAPTFPVDTASTASVRGEGNPVAAVLERALVVLDGAEWCLPDDPLEARERITEATQLLDQTLERVGAEQVEEAVPGLSVGVVLEQLAAAAHRCGQIAAIEVQSQDEGPPGLAASVAPAEAATLLRVATRALREADPRGPGHDRPAVEVRVGHATLELTARSRRPGAGGDACTQYLRVDLARDDAAGPPGEQPTGSPQRIVHTGVDSHTRRQPGGHPGLRSAGRRPSGTAAR
jgi:hypothetical protein